MNNAFSKWSLTVLPSVATLAFASSCSHDHTHESSMTIEDVVFGEGTNDESLEVMLGAPIQNDKRANVAAPTSGAVMSMPATFSWALVSTTAELLPGSKGWRRASLRSRSVFERAISVVEGTAHAHGTPASGTAYFMTVKNGEANVLRLFTKETSFQPDASQWEKLKGNGGACTIAITAAVFDEGRVVGGPWSGDAVAFVAR